MPAAPHPSRRPRLAAAAAAGLLLTACGADDGPAGAAGTTSAPPSTPPSTTSGSGDPSPFTGTDLAPGLLPAEAFGPGAQVTPLTEQQLAQGAAASAGSLEGAQITPEECAAAVAGTQPRPGDFDDLAAQVAVTGTTATVQLLSSGAPVADAVADLSDQVAACPEATISSPELGEATIAFQELDVPELGDEAAGATFVTTAAGPDGTPVAVPTTIALVRDGDRLVTLLSTDPEGGGLDPAAFAALLEQAYEVQADALG